MLAAMEMSTCSTLGSFSVSSLQARENTSLSAGGFDMSRFGAKLALILLLGCGVRVGFGQRVEWPVSDGGNGHFYEAVAVPDRINWTDAQAAVVAAGGYLATITSAEEQAFVYAQALANLAVWEPSGDRRGPWLGGLQPPGSPEPGGAWGWVTGEPFAYTYWTSGEPNNSGGTEYSQSSGSPATASISGD
jgi:hypothetical protein